MPDSRTIYSKAPIIECVIDIQIADDKKTSLSLLEQLASDLKGEFPSSLPLKQVEVAFDADSAGNVEPTTHREETLGFRLDRKAQDRVIQIRRNGFSYSHMPPYTGWPTFRQEGERFWSMYQAAVGCSSVSRIAVRVINRLPLRPADDWSMLKFVPNAPLEIAQSMRKVSMQVEAPLPKMGEGGSLTLSLYNAQEQKTGEVGLLLDIDVFVTAQTEVRNIFSTLDKLSDEKDRVFESCITETIRERIR